MTIGEETNSPQGHLLADNILCSVLQVENNL